MNTDLTTISIRKSTRQRLAERGQKLDSYDDIINRLIDTIEDQMK